VWCPIPLANTYYSVEQMLYCVLWPSSTLNWTCVHITRPLELRELSSSGVTWKLVEPMVEIRQYTVRSPSLKASKRTWTLEISVLVIVCILFAVAMNTSTLCRDVTEWSQKTGRIFPGFYALHWGRQSFLEESRSWGPFISQYVTRTSYLRKGIIVPFSISQRTSNI